MNKNLRINKNLQGLLSNLQMSSSLQKKCIMCAGLHLIGQCDMVDEFIAASKCKRNHEGRVVLPSGSYVPWDILPDAILMDRINEYHCCFPNQLAVAALIHTIASVSANQTIISSAHPTFKLSKEDQIATLEAEPFNLRRGPPIPAGGVRTRNQRAREQLEEEGTVEEIVTPAVRQKAAEVPNPVVPVISIPAEPSVAVAEWGARTQEEPEHPYQKVKDEVYIPPTSRNVGVPVKPATQTRPELAYSPYPLFMIQLLRPMFTKDRWKLQSLSPNISYFHYRLRFICKYKKSPLLNKFQLRESCWRKPS